MDEDDGVDVDEDRVWMVVKTMIRLEDKDKDYGNGNVMKMVITDVSNRSIFHVLY